MAERSPARLLAVHLTYAGVVADFAFFEFVVSAMFAHTGQPLFACFWWLLSMAKAGLAAVALRRALAGMRKEAARA